MFTSQQSSVSEEFRGRLLASSMCMNYEMKQSAILQQIGLKIIENSIRAA